MSKNITRTADQIADDALDAITHGKEYSRWLAALMVAIRLDAEHNKGRKVADLASLGQYLGEDCANYLDNEAVRLESELKEGEA